MVNELVPVLKDINQSGVGVLYETASSQQGGKMGRYDKSARRAYNRLEARKENI